MEKFYDYIPKEKHVEFEEDGSFWGYAPKQQVGFFEEDGSFWGYIPKYVYINLVK